MTVDSELETLLTTLKRHDVETYEHKDTKIVFRFPKKARAMLVVAPQDQVDDFDAGGGGGGDEAEDDDDVVIIDTTTQKAVPLPPAYKRLFRAVPREVT